MMQHVKEVLKIKYLPDFLKFDLKIKPFTVIYGIDSKKVNFLSRLIYSLRSAVLDGTTWKLEYLLKNSIKNRDHVYLVYEFGPTKINITGSENNLRIDEVKENGSEKEKLQNYYSEKFYIPETRNIVYYERYGCIDCDPFEEEYSMGLIYCHNTYDFLEDVFDEKTYKLLHQNMFSKYIVSVCYLIDSNRFSKIIHIEKPELGLHPKLQYELTRLLGYLYNKGARLVITTDSPYVITTINLLGLAYLEYQETKKAFIKSKYEDFWINPKDIAAYEVDEYGLIKPTKDKYGLINAENIDRVSEYIADLTDEILYD